MGTPAPTGYIVCSAAVCVINADSSIDAVAPAPVQEMARRTANQSGTDRKLIGKSKGKAGDQVQNPTAYESLKCHPNYPVKNGLRTIEIHRRPPLAQVFSRLNGNLMSMGEGDQHGQPDDRPLLHSVSAPQRAAFDSVPTKLSGLIQARSATARLEGAPSCTPSYDGAGEKV